MAGGPKNGKYESLLVALLNCADIQTAAKQAGISETTAYRWLKQDDFQELYRQAKREAVAQAVSRLQQKSSAAVEVLTEVAEDKEAPASSRVSAAKTIIEMALKAVELEDIVKRIEQLEEMAEKKG